MIIETPRLLLRVPRMEDVDEFQSAKEAMWEDLQKWMVWSASDQLARPATEAFFIRSIEQAQKGDYMLAGFCKDTGRFAIATGINIDGEVPGVYSTGYWVARDFLGLGYATEGANAAIRCAFGPLKARKVTISYYEGNDKSRRVIEKLGFTFVRTDTKTHKCHADGHMLDVHHYEMTDPSVLPPLKVSWRI